MISLTESSARSTAAIVIGLFFFVLDWVDFGLRKWQRNVPLKSFTDVWWHLPLCIVVGSQSSPLGETCIHLIGNEGPHDLVVARGRLVGFVEVIAYHASLKGKPAPAMDGFSDDQRFFLTNAPARRAKQRDDVLRNQLASNPHSPAKFRVIGPLRNVDA